MKFIIEKWAFLIPRKTIDLLFTGTKIMATIQEILAATTTLNATLSAVGTKLDAIATLIAGLQNATVSQAQLDELATAISAAQNGLNAISAKEDGIK